MAACKEGGGLEEDFRQLSDEAPSEGLTTMPAGGEKEKRLLLVPTPSCSPKGASVTNGHGGLHWWKRAETSARVCLRDVVVGGRRGPKACVASSSTRSRGRTSSLMLVSSRLLGEMERFQSSLFKLASTGNTTR